MSPLSVSFARIPDCHQRCRLSRGIHSVSNDVSAAASVATLSRSRGGGPAPSASGCREVLLVSWLGGRGRRRLGCTGVFQVAAAVQKILEPNRLPPAGVGLVAAVRGRAIHLQLAFPRGRPPRDPEVLGADGSGRSSIPLVLAFLLAGGRSVVRHCHQQYRSSDDRQWEPNVAHETSHLGSFPEPERLPQSPGELYRYLRNSLIGLRTPVISPAEQIDSPDPPSPPGPASTRLGNGSNSTGRPRAKSREGGPRLPTSVVAIEDTPAPIGY